MSFSWCGLSSILGIVLFIAIIISLLGGIKSLRPLLIIPLVLVCIVILSTLAAVFIPAIRRERALRENNQSTIVELLPSPVSRASAPLPGVMEAEFEPDIYPSFGSAAKGLMKKLADRKEEGYQLGTVQFIGNHWRNEKSQFQTILDRTFSGQTATTSSSQPAGKAMDLVVELSSEAKKIILRAKAATTSFVYEASYADKDWVDNFAGYMASDPGQNLLVARSGQACTSEAEATQQAYQDAAKKLLPYVESQFRRFRLYRDIREDELLPLIVSQLHGSLGTNLEKDQFVQSYHRPYGTIWSSSMLLDASPGNISLLRMVCQKQYYGGLMSTGYVLLCGVILVGVICLLYWVVNSYTKGYYTWPLRATVVIIFLVIAGALVCVV